VFGQPRDYLRYILLETEDDDMANLLRNRNNRIAVGNLLSGNNAFETWLEDQRLLSGHLTGLNTHVKYIHTKYLLLDPLGDNPVVITGSANYSCSCPQPDSGFLEESDTWRAPFYEPGTVQYKERQYFSRAA
jgi:hypothetical protein